MRNDFAFDTDTERSPRTRTSQPQAGFPFVAFFFTSFFAVLYCSPSHATALLNRVCGGSA